VPRPAILIAAGCALTTAVVGFVLLRPSAPERTEPVQPSAQTPPPAPGAAAAPAPSTATEPARPARPAVRRPAAEADAAAPAVERPASPVAAAPAAPVRNALTIHSDVPGAQVFIDRRFVGNAPVTVDDLEPGQHRLNLSADGFDGISRTIDVEPGEREMTVRFREVRLNAALPIVHKHRLGSCTGRLVADADGIRYETSNQEDGFRAALSDIEAFEVNYLEKNLRIKLRKGREYNFTDPGKDADRLFVFHRDVERARGLLAKGYQPATD
jgi:hypothetical protein